MFVSERELVETTVPILHDRYSLKDEGFIVEEPGGLFGIPDVMLYSEFVISIEFKLQNWKRALMQAYRYKGFSHKSYVILDEAKARPAIANLDMFEHYNIGLCTVKEENMTCHYEPAKETPFSPRLAEKARSYFNLD